MGSLLRLLPLLPRNILAPVVFLAAGWYGGAKHGAPELLMTTVDGAIAQGTELISTVLPAADNEAS